MKLLLAVILTLALILIGLCIFNTYRLQQGHKLARTVGRILIWGFCIVLFNLITLLTKSELVCFYAYGAYFVASIWMLYYFLRFSIEYIGNVFEKHVNRPIMILLLLVDSVLIGCNAFYPYMYSIKHVELFSGESFYELETTPIFYIHYAIILMLVTFCLISLYYRTFNSPSFYKRKYLIIAVIMTILIVLNLFTLKSAVDVSVIGYVVEGICIYYCAFVYTPQRLLTKTLYTVAKDMSVALFVMDIEGKVLYKNSYANRLLSAENPPVNGEGVSLEKWCHDEYMNHEAEFTKEETFYTEDEELVLKIQLQRIQDKRAQLQGGYFVIQDRTEEINKLKKEKYIATHDTLTGLYNKQYFYEKVGLYLKKNPEEQMLMVCTDIKDFKMINDFLGTKTGDVVLQNFARILKERMVKAVCFGRLGNDVFGVLIEKGCYSDLLFDNNNQTEFFAGMKKEVSFPIINYVGVYEITDRALPVSVMCDRARMAIAKIKGDYHKRIAYYDETLREKILHEQELVSEVGEALAKGQIKMYLQPQMSVDGKLLGAEALVRWIHPTKGPIMPSEFIPVFEKNGLISDIDRYIWETACKQLKKWKTQGRDDLYISVNISPRDFYFLNIYQEFTQLVEKYRIAPQNIKLEITETAIVMDLKRQMELIERLRHNGFIVEMDDFGSGYSSLNMLKEIHVDVLKIDMAFLKKAEDEERSKKILQMVIGLSRQLGMPVITEGIENAEQVAFLSEIGCEMFQGYYFAKPMSVEEFEEAYINN